MVYLWAVLLAIVVIASWFLTLFALPGNWVIVVAMVAFAVFTPEGSPVDVGAGVLIALVVLALVGELIELLTGAIAAKRAGGSRRGALLAIAGSLIGAIIGAFVGLPIPVFGSLIGILFFASLGALAGAMLGEQWKGRTFDESWNVGRGAFWGRLWGSLGKIGVGVVMVVVSLLALLIN